MGPSATKNGPVLVTGAAGYLGRLLLERLAGGRPLVALDVRPIPEDARLPGVRYVTRDIRSRELAGLLEQHEVEVVAHLAFVVNETGGDRAVEYQVDVLGTRNVLESCLAAGVRKIVVTSSGAAYGYHADNPVPLRESDPVRGNESIVYAYHKRLVEELLARWRVEHPELEQLVLRLCAVLGKHASNPITALFDARVVVDVQGSRTGFCFVSDRDVVECLARGIESDATGVYNVAGDGTVSMREIATRLGKPYLALPAAAMRAGLALGRRLGLARFGPEQVPFLQYRPVLSNEKLAKELGYVPQPSRAVFEAFAAARERA